MKLLIKRTDLAKALRGLKPATGGKSPLAAVKGVLISALDDRILLQTTNLDFWMEMECPGEIKAPGVALPEYEVLAGLVLTYTGELVELSFAKKTLRVICELDTATVATMYDEDFPDMAEEDGKPITISATKLRKLFDRVAFAAGSASEFPTDTLLQCVHMTVKDKLLTLEAANRRMLAHWTAKCSESEEHDLVMLAATPWNSFIPPEGEVKIRIADAAVHFRNDALRVAVRRVSLEYFSTAVITEREVPTDHVCRTDRDVLLGTLKRSIVIHRGDLPKAKFEMADGEVVFLTNAEMGTARDQLAAEYEGDGFEFGILSDMLVKVLRHCDKGRVRISSDGDIKKTILVHTGDDEMGCYHVMSLAETPKG